MNKLREYFKNYYVLNDVSGVLFWDNATNLPKKSIDSRSEQMSILSKFTDTIFRAEEVQEEIEKAENTKLTETDSKCLKLMKSIIIKENAIDPDLKSLLIKKKLICEINVSDNFKMNPLFSTKIINGKKIQPKLDDMEPFLKNSEKV